jgi:ATP-dependent protease ClpP protease subunit
MTKKEANVTDISIFELPKEATRIWELPVPVVVDNKTKTIKAYLTGSIEEPQLYNELCYLLDTAEEDYTVYLHINTPGGVIDSAFMITNSIKNCKAKVIGHLSGTVASAGTLISMACHELEITDHLSFMIHNYSGGMAGKGHEMKARQKFTDDHLNEAFKTFYSGFLSEEEMDKVIEGTDLWMSSEEVTTRWQDRLTYLSGK